LTAASCTRHVGVINQHELLLTVSLLREGVCAEQTVRSR